MLTIHKRQSILSCSALLIPCELDVVSRAVRHLEFVADSPDSCDPTHRVFIFDLTPESLDMLINCALVAEKLLIVPNLLEQFLSGKDSISILG